MVNPYLERAAAHRRQERRLGREEAPATLTLTKRDHHVVAADQWSSGAYHLHLHDRYDDGLQVLLLPVVQAWGPRTVCGGVVRRVRGPQKTAVRGQRLQLQLPGPLTPL